jgi:hypothetical protein
MSINSKRKIFLEDSSDTSCALFLAVTLSLLAVAIASVTGTPLSW